MITFLVNNKEYILNGKQVDKLFEHWRDWTIDYVKWVYSFDYIRKYSNCDDFVAEFLESLA